MDGIIKETGMGQKYKVSTFNIRFSKEKPLEKFQLTWHKSIESKSKQHTYKYLKTEFRCEPYIISIWQIFGNRTAGRYYGISRNRHICKSFTRYENM